jgi:hypothetical protein
VAQPVPSVPNAFPDFGESRTRCALKYTLLP